MNIIKETTRRIGRIAGYVGVCDGCGTPVEYDDELVVIELNDVNNNEKILLVPIDRLVCPNCNIQIGTIQVWRSLDVSKELHDIER